MSILTILKIKLFAVDKHMIKILSWFVIIGDGLIEMNRPIVH